MSTRRADGALAVQVNAPAKINLTLRVVRRRPDGYHELRTTFQSIALCDTLTFRTEPGPFRIVCVSPGCPTDDTNLVWRAARMLWNAAGRAGSPSDLVVHIDKQIPVQAGLGGGSSDAGAAIRALSHLWGLKLARRDLFEIARQLGADVPFFLVGGTVSAAGRGDELASRADAARGIVVIVVPPFGVSTTEAFGWWDRQRRARVGPSGTPVANDLEEPVASRHPEIRDLVRILRRHGARRAAMSGSGSAVFGLFARRADAERAASTLREGPGRVILTRTIARSGYARLVHPRICAKSASV